MKFSKFLQILFCTCMNIAVVLCAPGTILDVYRHVAFAELSLHDKDSLVAAVTENLVRSYRADKFIDAPYYNQHGHDCDRIVIADNGFQSCPEISGCTHVSMSTFKQQWGSSWILCRGIKTDLGHVAVANITANLRWRALLSGPEVSQYADKNLFGPEGYSKITDRDFLDFLSSSIVSTFVVVRDMFKGQRREYLSVKECYNVAPPSTEELLTGSVLQTDWVYNSQEGRPVNCTFEHMQELFANMGCGPADGKTPLDLTCLKVFNHPLKITGRYSGYAVQQVQVGAMSASYPTELPVEDCNDSSIFAPCTLTRLTGDLSLTKWPEPCDADKRMMVLSNMWALQYKSPTQTLVEDNDFVPTINKCSIVSATPKAIKIIYMSHAWYERIAISLIYDLKLAFQDIVEPVLRTTFRVLAAVVKETWNAVLRPVIDELSYVIMNDTTTFVVTLLLVLIVFAYYAAKWIKTVFSLQS